MGYRYTGLEWQTGGLYGQCEVLDKAQWGSIVLFHLHGAHTVEALRELIPQLLNIGYQLDTIDRLNHL